MEGKIEIETERQNRKQPSQPNTRKRKRTRKIEKKDWNIEEKKLKHELQGAEALMPNDMNTETRQITLKFQTQKLTQFSFRE